jgi:hypothetical protein
LTLKTIVPSSIAHSFTRRQIIDIFSSRLSQEADYRITGAILISVHVLFIENFFLFLCSWQVLRGEHHVERGRASGAHPHAPVREGGCTPFQERAVRAPPRLHSSRRKAGWGRAECGPQRLARSPLPGARATARATAAAGCGARPAAIGARARCPCADTSIAL